jgi:hypothetical protein
VTSTQNSIYKTFTFGAILGSALITACGDRPPRSAGDRPPNAEEPQRGRPVKLPADLQRELAKADSLEPSARLIQLRTLRTRAARRNLDTTKVPPSVLMVMDSQSAKLQRRVFEADSARFHDRMQKGQPKPLSAVTTAPFRAALLPNPLELLRGLIAPAASTIQASSFTIPAEVVGKLSVESRYTPFRREERGQESGGGEEVTTVSSGDQRLLTERTITRMKVHLCPDKLGISQGFYEQDYQLDQGGEQTRFRFRLDAQAQVDDLANLVNVTYTSTDATERSSGHIKREWSGRGWGRERAINQTETPASTNRPYEYKSLKSLRWSSEGSEFLGGEDSKEAANQRSWMTGAATREGMIELEKRYRWAMYHWKTGGCVRVEALERVPAKVEHGQKVPIQARTPHVEDGELQDLPVDARGRDGDVTPTQEVSRANFAFTVGSGKKPSLWLGTISRRGIGEHIIFFDVDSKGDRLLISSATWKSIGSMLRSEGKYTLRIGEDDQVVGEGEHRNWMEMPGCTVSGYEPRWKYRISGRRERGELILTFEPAGVINSEIKPRTTCPGGGGGATTAEQATSGKHTLRITDQDGTKIPFKFGMGGSGTHTLTVIK